jgi:DnaJ-class molecular chaperone
MAVNQLATDLKLLGLEKGASLFEVKSAYRRLIMECHPDLHRNDRTFHFKFIALTNAYQRCIKGLGSGNMG